MVLVKQNADKGNYGWVKLLKRGINMKVGIIGGGSIGLLFAAYLSKLVEVVMYTRTQEQASQINQHGIVLKKATEEREVSRVKSMPFFEWSGTEDFNIVAVKQYQLPSIIEKVNQFKKSPRNLLFLQNGMGHLKLLSRVEAANIFLGSIEHGALREKPYGVSHNGQGVTNVAVYRGDAVELRQLAALGTADFPILYQSDYYDMLVKKLIANALINPLTAILQVKNGALIENPFYYHVIQNLFTEIVYILELKQPEAYWQQVISICKRTADNYSSMLKDVAAKRVTEVDAILGFLLEEAARRGKEAPQLENIFLLIKGKEIVGEAGL